MIDAFFGWANAQPVWFQVVIGLTVFFIGIPLALGSCWMLILGLFFVIGRLILLIQILLMLTPALLIIASSIAAAYGLWLVAEYLAWEIIFPLKPALLTTESAFEGIFRAISIAVLVLLLAPIFMLLFKKREFLVLKLGPVFQFREFWREEA